MVLPFAYHLDQHILLILSPQFAGTSRSTVLHLTSLMPFFLTIPENRYLSIPSGTGATALNVVAGSAPITTATSIRLSMIFVALSCDRLSFKISRCCAPRLCICQCIIAFLAFKICILYTPMLVTSVSGCFVTVRPKVMNFPASPLNDFSIGRVNRSALSSVKTISLTGPFSMCFGP